MSRPRYKRSIDHPAQHRSDVPVTLPHVVMTVNPDGAMTVSVDGAPYEPEPFAAPWRRESFAQLVDQLTTDRRCPIRIEVRESDGTVFTDIITPGRRRTPASFPEPAAEPAAPIRVKPPVLTAVSSQGFVPGEDVAVAVIVAHSDAAPDGTARGLLTAEQIAQSPTAEAILFGRISGTISVRRPG